MTKLGTTGMLSAAGVPLQPFDDKRMSRRNSPLKLRPEIRGGTSVIVSSDGPISNLPSGFGQVLGARLPGNSLSLFRHARSNRSFDMIQRPRLHIIDDDPQYCDLVKFHLKNYFLITVSNGGFEGYSRVKSQRPDVIILDQHMEGWNGIETLLAIRQQEKTKNIPVLMITSDASREVVMSVLAAGANGFLRKDEITAENLLDRLNGILPAKNKLQLSGK